MKSVLRFSSSLTPRMLLGLALAFGISQASAWPAHPKPGKDRHAAYSAKHKHRHVVRVPVKPDLTAFQTGPQQTVQSLKSD